MKALFLLLWLGLGGAVGAQSLPDAALSAVEYEQRLGAQMPINTELRDEHGAAVRLASYLGQKPAILVFAYHECPNLCSVVLTSLVESLRNLRQTVGTDFEVLVVSIDPAETPAIAAAGKLRYAQRYGRYGSERGWHFLTGPTESIQALTAAAGFHYRYDETSHQFAHASGVALLTPSGRISQYLLGVEFPPAALQVALERAGREHVGSLAQRLLLLCFHYNPMTGRYGTAIHFALQAACFGTVAALAGGIYWLSRRRRSALA